MAIRAYTIATQPYHPITITPMYETRRKGGIISLLRNLYRLSVQDLRLLLAEKLSLLAAGAVMLVLGLLFGAIAMAFLTISLTDLFRSTMSSSATYAIIGGGYVLLVAIVYIFRKALIFNPIARFISRVVLDPPESASIHPQDTPTADDDAQQK